ncbi:hypothetical protein J1G44_06110 [Cellulomonas sp. zg-ZUI199]|uniref:Uncharacterized protein n=1 Tax=Cellulomonas wangleii TaxID=2816956 RepID=A0ABX8D3N7_9CELL|nr:MULTISPECIES: hypothetical protein [Cellulomonas]MBO0898942.1 hypothetical protein [Cellulomonas sp. zg-ZUI22]MBO0923771.1 hypothetical protein [Cellulomonas wangleii]MBO0924053.1 hypothetical protein [Cellulomonas wangleii]QVI62079.1 hypothetical protein KG103_16960 [Cellulomonas wangleii]
MKIELPEELRTFAYRELTVVEPNDTDVERMLTQIFELAIKQGRTATNVSAAKLYDEKRAALAQSGHLAGFNDTRGRAVLDGWLRASVVEMGRAGRARASEQMQYLRPTTVAVFRAGFPARSRHRGADMVVYRELLREMAARLGPSEGSTDKAAAWIREQFTGAFGPGVTFSDPPKWAPTYDGTTDVDITALLTLYFVELFDAKSAAKDRDAEQTARYRSPVPGATRPLGADVLDYLQAYGERAPSLVMSQHMAAILGLRLFQLPLRIARATRELIETGQIPHDMVDDDASNPLEQYVDFTGSKGSPSDLLARECVQRDLEITRQFFRDRLYLLSIRGAPALKAELADQSLSPAERVALVADAKEIPRVVGHLEYLLSRIVDLNEQSDDEDARHFLATMEADPRPAADRLADVLVEALKKRGYENAVKWFWSAGGIKTDIGVLTGALNVRSSWAYAPSDKLLASLLAVTFARRGGGAAHAELTIGEVLKQLEERFGLLVNRPPCAMATAANRAAAAENLEAFKYRLQLLGVFEGLSDDLDAQRVRNPLVNLSENA